MLTPGGALSVFDPARVSSGRGESMHLFSGAGGDLQASEMAGLRPRFAANHWTRAIDTSSRNFADVDHAIGDLSVIDPKRFPKGFANVLYASPECDGHSSARNYREALRELGPYYGPGHKKNGIERSRCTMWCPQRWADYHRFDFVVMENVVDVVRWGAFNAWVAEWKKLGYDLKAVFANSAFFGVPQSRDRVYFIAYRHGIPEPDLDFRPLAYCWDCSRDVYGVQSWKPVALKNAGPVGPTGKYGPRNQYLYRCPDCAAVTSPYITPSWTAIDWSNPGVRLRDREAAGLPPLKDTTVARMARGLVKYGYTLTGPMAQLVPLDRLGYDKNTRPVWLPASTITGRQDVGVLVPPGFQLAVRGTNQPRAFAEPFDTVAASGNHLGIVQPELLVQVGGNTFERPGYTRAWHTDEPAPAVTADNVHGVVGRPLMHGEGFAVANYGDAYQGHVRDSTREPLGTLTAGGSIGLTQQAVMRVPRDAVLSSYYGNGDVARHISEPAGTITGVDRHGLVQPPAGFLARSGGTRQADLVDVRVDPVPTRVPTENYGVVGAAVDVMDCTFRMIGPPEAQRVMGLEHRYRRHADGITREEYEFTGTNRDQVRLSGNGITPVVEAWISDRVLTATGA